MWESTIWSTRKSQVTIKVLAIVGPLVCKVMMWMIVKMQCHAWTWRTHEQLHKICCGHEHNAPASVPVRRTKGTLWRTHHAHEYNKQTLNQRTWVSCFLLPDRELISVASASNFHQPPRQRKLRHSVRIRDASGQHRISRSTCAWTRRPRSTTVHVVQERRSPSFRKGKFHPNWRSQDPSRWARSLHRRRCTRHCTWHCNQRCTLCWTRWWSTNSLKQQLTSCPWWVQQRDWFQSQRWRKAWSPQLRHSASGRPN